ncbi:peptidase A2 [Novosphingobium sp. PC22D]|uniref:aspartyl protease family protein n=1 Tax=Novosphingobium sp. PC22D TaxID=1962403 RepID=UPI000BEFCCF7|nr:aspartyl protease family protein [Novosphingobium sp. PC22D]PEQ11340.1 peptidase A2 [Novosphingobium sp. PC22D]
MSGTATALALLVANPVILQAETQPLSGEASQTEEVVQGLEDAHERMTVPVALDGTGPYRFLIDTGSQRTVVSTGVADRLALAVGPQVRIVSIAGVAGVASAHVGEMQFGEQILTGLQVPVLDGRHIGADGIVGTDSLQDRRVLLDFDRNLIAIGDPQELGGNSGFEIVVRARRKSGQLIITKAVIDGIKTSVVVDTGASNSIGNLALQRALGGRGAGAAVIASVTGQTLDASIGVANKLSIGTLEVSNVAIAFADTPAFRELDLHRKPALFLGMRELRAFRRVAIDFPTREVRFDVNQVRAFVNYKDGPSLID